MDCEKGGKVAGKFFWQSEEIPAITTKGVKGKGKEKNHVKAKGPGRKKKQSSARGFNNWTQTAYKKAEGTSKQKLHRCANEDRTSLSQ